MDINEIKEKYAVNTANEAMERIVDLGCDYDGFSNEKDLKSLIDEMVELAVLAKRLMHVSTNGVEPVRHGHWLHDPDRKKTICTVCRRDIELPSYYYTVFNFCPKCGAKMDGKENT